MGNATIDTIVSTRGDYNNDFSVYHCCLFHEPDHAYIDVEIITVEGFIC